MVGSFHPSVMFGTVVQCCNNTLSLNTKDSFYQFAQCTLGMFRRFEQTQGLQRNLGHTASLHLPVGAYTHKTFKFLADDEANQEWRWDTLAALVVSNKLSGSLHILTRPDV